MVPFLVLDKASWYSCAFFTVSLHVIMCTSKILSNRSEGSH